MVFKRHKKAKNEIKEYPCLYISNINFKDGTQLSLNDHSIVVFVGSNNCGKSQMLLDIENSIQSSDDLVIINSANLSLKGNIDYPEFIERNFKKIQNNELIRFHQDYSTDLNNLITSWDTKDMYSIIPELFVKRITTEERLTISNSCYRDSKYIKEPFYKLHDDDKKMAELSDLFSQAFGEDLLLNKGDLLKLSLHVGKGPDKSKYTIDNCEEYWEKVSMLPELQKQGDGMRSFASLLIDAFTSDYSITLVDEPEAFLHPPQARLLGKMLVEHNSERRQLFVSTHSEDFLQGILDANSENVIVIRICRDASTNSINILNQEKIKTLWGNPIMRYSNILSGIFHDKVVVCESDYDCLFYNAIVEAVCINEKTFPPDILFTHCGGKDRMKDIINALKIVGTQVVGICDFDVINDSRSFKALSKSFGIVYSDCLEQYMKTVYNEINAVKEEKYKENLKKLGKVALRGDAPLAYEKVEEICFSEGLFIVPVGEMESFDRTINSEKKDWVYSVLNNYDLALEPKLQEARDFINQIIKWKSKLYIERLVANIDKDYGKSCDGVG